MQRSKVTRLVDSIGQYAAEQLAPVVQARFGHLPDNEVEAAILAVTDVLDDADLTDEVLFEVDADAEKLAKLIRRQFPDRPRTAALDPAAWPVYNLVLDQSCRYLVQVLHSLPSFQPAALSEVLARLTGLADTIDALLSRVPLTSLRTADGSDEAFEAEYLTALVRTLDRLELVGLPDDKQPALKLTAAYLSLSALSDSRRASAPLVPKELVEHLGHQHSQALPVELAIGGHRRVLLRGEAGSGKTTLVHWLAVRAAQHELTGSLVDWNGLVPFVIRLRSHAAGDLPGPERFAHDTTPQVAGAMPSGWAHRQLASGRALLLVDGVDEVPPARRRGVKTWLTGLLDTYPETRVVVTSRTAAAQRRWLTSFTAISLEPMSPANVHDFIERWHKAAGQSDRSAERRLQGQMKHPHLRELAATPLLCAMLCALNLVRKSELPRNRMDLYRTALSMLLHLRDAERGIPSLLSDAQKRVLLRDLAWRMTLGSRAEMRDEQALAHLTRKLPEMPKVDGSPEALLTDLVERSGVLRSPVPGKVDFIHRTFQEYLAADEAIQQHHIETLVGQAHLDTWRETIVMACGHATAKQADELINGILDRADQGDRRARRLRLLGAACLETVADIAAPARQRVDAAIERHLIPPRSFDEVEVLGALGEKVLRFLPKDLNKVPSKSADLVIRLAALTDSQAALPILAAYAQDARKEVYYGVCFASSLFDPETYVNQVMLKSPHTRQNVMVLGAEIIPHLTPMRDLKRFGIVLTSPGISGLGGVEPILSVESLTVVAASSLDGLGELFRIFPRVAMLVLAGDCDANLSGAEALPLQYLLVSSKTVNLECVASISTLKKVILCDPIVASGLEGVRAEVEIIRG
ncbi:energy-coupling factor transporter ATP-binding protein EcfA2 [Actinokineospora baliensis]|nr:NACHT domain-containing protein [Actinokineospora baliensis]MBM7769969.1 energy-coupling factor transporter ATP-binding protein EcfA2 [Actinokineospora baliensis]